MPRFSLTSLRSRAISLVFLAILPLLALTLYLYFDQRNRAVAEVQRDELVTARNLAALQETLLRNTRQLLTTLARLPVVQRRDRDGCAALFAGLLEQNPSYAIIGAADPEGRVFASAPAAPAPVNITDRPFFQKAIRTRAFAVGEPLLGRISGKYNLPFAYPVMDENGRLQAVLYAGLDLEWLGNLLAKSDFPPTTALVLTDATGKVLFRYPDPLRYTGRMAPAPLIQPMATQVEGVAEGVGLPGDVRLFAFARLSPPWQDLRLAIGLPKDLAITQVNRDLGRNLIWLGLVALLSLVAAWFGGNSFILQPVAKFLEVTRRLTGGDLTARTGPLYQAGELGQLAQTFDHMADSIQERDEKLKQQVVELDERSAQLEAANKELEAFSYSVSHDLRSPLRGIAGFSRILLEDYADRLDEQGQKYLGFLQTDAHKMGKLIDDLLALSRLGRREMSFARFEMDSLARTVLAELQALEPGRTIQTNIQPLPAAYGDRAMLRQVLVNLLANALKFTRNKEAAVIEVSGRTEGNENIYCVRDNGDGFDMAYVHKLFGVFQRLHTDEKFEGTGVGLAIVKRIIDRHGGRLWAEGKVNGGAAFCFALPKDNGT